MKPVPLLAMALAGCTSTSTIPAGRYLGTATPITPGPLCTASKAVAQLRDTVVIFAPDEGTWVLNGIANPDGTLTADHARIASNRQVYDTTFEARWTTAAINGTYKTPRCTFTVTLARE